MTAYDEGLTRLRNIILITLDCVRPDHLGCFGYAGVATPTIDHLARNGILFQQAICQAPNTWVSLASVFTGCNPIKHGLHTPYDGITDYTPTIAEILSENGFHTIGLPAHNLVGRAANFHKGFDVFYEDNFKFDSKIPGMKWYSDWNDVLSVARGHISQNKGKPLFIWFHYMNTHHMPDNGIFLPDSYRQNHSDRWQYYDGKISYADKVCVSNILKMLRDNGILEDSIIIIFSDHGEELENGSLPKHDNNLFDDVLRIVLIISGPAIQPANRRVKHLVRSIDIFPTVLEMLNISFSDIDVDGQSLVPLFTSENGSAKNWAYSENVVNNLVSIRTSNWKLVIEIQKSTASQEIKIHPRMFQLFKVDASSFQKDKLLGQVPYEMMTDKVKPILRSLEESLNQAKNVGSSEPDKIHSVLKSLGYV